MENAAGKASQRKCPLGEALGRFSAVPEGKTLPTLSQHPHSSPLPGPRTEASGAAPYLCFYDIWMIRSKILRGEALGEGVIEPGSGVRETWL